MKDSAMNFEPLTIYRLLVRSILHSRRNDRISNDSDAHAKVLISALIDSAETSVDIFCHKLSSDVWCSEEVIDSIRKAVYRGVCFRVVTQDEADKVSVDAFAKLRIAIRRNGSTMIDSNFMIVDRRAFRVEVDYRERVGFAYANNPEYSAVLNNAFSAIYEPAI